KQQFTVNKLAEDSVYARILHRIGLLDYYANNQVATKNSIIFTKEAIRINSAGKKDNSPAFCVNSYSNLVIFYESLRMYNLAAQCCDSALVFKKKYKVPAIPELALRFDKSQMSFRAGDFQKAIDESTVTILQAKAPGDSLLLHNLLNLRAQSYLVQGDLNLALADVKEAAKLSTPSNVTDAINSMVITAKILAEKKDLTKALPLFYKGINQRIKTKNYRQISDDYTDLGNVYFNHGQYIKAKECYSNTIKYASKAMDFEQLAKGRINLGQVSFRQHRYSEAEQFCAAALKDLNLTTSNDIFINPAASALNSVGNKELVLIMLGNKTEILLTQFLKTNNKKYLSACLQTAMLTDTLITLIRHEQFGEKSKLYYRNRTREFFMNALEACYVANDPALAYYFMEKSRAVLLNDKLNELGASAHLPQVDALQEHALQIAVISALQKLGSLEKDKHEYELQQVELLEAKGTLEHFIKSLEQKYPAYYQYKYADEVPPLNALQKHLLKNNENFVHYFINDTMAFMLGITPSGTRLVKLSGDKFNSNQLISFLSLCSAEPNSTDQFNSYATLSYKLYTLLFQPLKIAKGRVIICPDNFLIPFEALSADATGTNFLIKDYIFSYVFSARFLMQKYNSYKANGDFIGFAPVSFKAYDSIVDLKQSGDALMASAKHYTHTGIFINKKATRQSFISSMGGYSVVNIFSHANADTTENEPILYMHDSVIHLSELQMIRNPATQLVVLSACKTNVGKNAKGEGIFSLARGFAISGIPSVAATLWKADELTIYTISEKFHELLSQGIPKDEALQKAKLHFMNNGSSEKPFPYYWANLVLLGNEEPLRLSESHLAWWIAGLIL
ncbi:MAG: CHAT domain-containing tetratricopeptide repeat protein, partial [Ferruginibacter sp.]